MREVISVPIWSPAQLNSSDSHEPPSPPSVGVGASAGAASSAGATSSTGIGSPACAKMTYSWSVVGYMCVVLLAGYATWSDRPYNQRTVSAARVFLLERFFVAVTTTVSSREVIPIAGMSAVTFHVARMFSAHAT